MSSNIDNNVHCFQKTYIPSSEEVNLLRKVQFINNRWIVRGNLSDTANKYIQSLLHSDSQPIDSMRLYKSCHMALSIVNKLHPHIIDPKAHFYPALFSLMTRSERIKYLSGHPFCYLTVSLATSKHISSDFLQSLKPATTQRIYKIAKYLRDIHSNYEDPTILKTHPNNNYVHNTNQMFFEI